MKYHLFAKWSNFDHRRWPRRSLIVKPHLVDKGVLCAVPVLPCSRRGYLRREQQLPLIGFPDGMLDSNIPYIHLSCLRWIMSNEVVGKEELSYRIAPKYEHNVQARDWFFRRYSVGSNQHSLSNTAARTTRRRGKEIIATNLVGHLHARECCLRHPRKTSILPLHTRPTLVGKPL